MDHFNRLCEWWIWVGVVLGGLTIERSDRYLLGEKKNKHTYAKDEDLNYSSNSSDWEAGRDLKFKELQWIRIRESGRRKNLDYLPDL